MVSNALGYENVFGFSGSTNNETLALIDDTGGVPGTLLSLYQLTSYLNVVFTAF